MERQGILREKADAPVLGDLCSGRPQHNRGFGIVYRSRGPPRPLPGGSPAAAASKPCAGRPRKIDSRALDGDRLQEPRRTEPDVQVSLAILPFIASTGILAMLAI